ncbi:beta-lactamase [Burkholderia sp. K24]|uniref:MBL fold metallo-hydrolase n=1 Tax=Paraburkholderia fungorum TaxID=134537 RepID=UPI00054CF33A|nr:MBL fold metallo-hydrolase [Paraburkholderia fungorum]KFX63946.1 beta-lactamase [Burkholderia sp. K24]MBU7436204.1 MBL fold metallo-hydrolase [Paraburkholderia fungorum]
MKEVSQGVVQRDKAILAYPFDTVPSAGAALEVAPGVLWIRMPMPLALSHINVWAIDDGEGWAIVDTGLVTDATATAWYRLFADALDQRPVTRVFVTHMHPDHVGMAGWMTRMFACRLWMTRLEYLSCCNLAGNAGREVSEDAIRFYRRAGWSDATIKDYCVHFDDLSGSVYSIPDSFRRLRDGERILIGGCEWRIIVGSGHSPEHACLYSADLKLLISGDQVLPRISSNVSVYATEPDADPVSEWLASLVRLKDEVPDDVLVLPAHNEPFRRLHARLDELIESQLRSLDRLRESLREPKRVIDLFGVLFARNVDADLMLLSMATGETIACLNHLIARDEVIAQADHANVLWYRKR